MAAYFIFGRLSEFFPNVRFSWLQVVLIFAAVINVFSGRVIAQQPEAVVIQGVVNDANGNPIFGAVVRLEQSGVGIRATGTDASGSFSFANVRSGNYSLSAEKADMHASEAISAGGGAPNIILVLSAATARAGNMDFTDKANFSIAGITDWTAVGGHGSDASLRTSETLARDAATLSPNGASVATHMGNTESVLRAAVATSPKSFAANRELGRFCMQKRNYREAIPPLEIAYRIEPANRTNEYDLVLAYKETGDFMRAQEHVRHLLTTENTADFHRLKGDVDEAMGDALSAEREYEIAVHLEPSEGNEFALGAELLLHRAVWPAIDVFRKGASAYPKSTRMLSALGVALFASAQYEEAAQFLCKASDLNPMDAVPYTFLGEIEISAPAPLDCAEQKLARFAQSQPENARATYYYAMAILKRQGVHKDAEKVEFARSLLMKAAEADPKFGGSYLQLGILSLDRKDYQQAINLFTKAIEANPQLSDAHYRLGIAYQRLGLAEKAKREFDRHDVIEKTEAEAVEQQRHKVKQFMVVLQGPP